MSWTDDERLYQPRLAGKRVRELHKIAEDTGKPMTRVLDDLVSRGVEEHNESMENKMERLKEGVSYFQLQGDETWRLSFVNNTNGEVYEIENENLKDLIDEASKLVFPAVSSEDRPEVRESSVQPPKENQ